MLTESRLVILKERNPSAAALVKKGYPLTVETLFDYECPGYLPESLDSELKVRLQLDVELYKELIRNQESKTSLLPEGRLLRLAYIDSIAARIIDRGERVTANNYGELAFSLVHVGENRGEMLERAIFASEQLLREESLGIPDGYNEEGWEEAKAFNRHRHRP